MKYFITGGAGFIGTNLIRKLVADGHEVVSIDDYSIGMKENHIDGCTYYDIDITSKNIIIYINKDGDVQLTTASQEALNLFTIIEIGEKVVPSGVGFDVLESSDIVGDMQDYSGDYSGGVGKKID